MTSEGVESSKEKEGARKTLLRELERDPMTPEELQTNRSDCGVFVIMMAPKAPPEAAGRRPMWF